MHKNGKESMEEYVYEELKAAILNAKIPVKMQLSEEQLAEAFNVSRTPIRSVLKRLQYEKMIRIVPNKGAFINLPSSKEIEEVLHVRTILEQEAVKVACRTATDRQLNEMESLTHTEEQLYKKGEYDKAIQVTSRFHQEIIDLTGNEIMASYSRELINITNIYLAYHDHADKESPLCPSEHRAIIQAIRERDEEKAVRVFLNHFATVKENLDTDKSAQEIQFTDIFKPFHAN